MVAFERQVVLIVVARGKKESVHLINIVHEAVRRTLVLPLRLSFVQLRVKAETHRQKIVKRRLRQSYESRLMTFLPMFIPNRLQVMIHMSQGSKNDILYFDHTCHWVYSINYQLIRSPLPPLFHLLTSPLPQTLVCFARSNYF